MSKPLALIIEDDKDLARIFSEALLQAAFETEIIRDGQAALERLAEVTPMVVVLDLHLPRVSGEEILRQIRSDERLAETRVMIATADSQMAQNLRDDADVVLLKPVSFEQLYFLAGRMRPSGAPPMKKMA
jgi:CheY-like chemotaxis protein